MTDSILPKHLVLIQGLVEELRTAVHAAYGPDVEPVYLTVRVSNGGRMLFALPEVAVPTATEPVQPPVAAAKPAAGLRHTPDWATVIWQDQYGENHTFYFNAAQAKIVRLLHENKRDGMPELSHAYLLEQITGLSEDEDDGTAPADNRERYANAKFASVFRQDGKKHPAVGTFLISPGRGGKGTVRLAD